MSKAKGDIDISLEGFPVTGGTNIPALSPKKICNIMLTFLNKSFQFNNILISLKCTLKLVDIP